MARSVTSAVDRCNVDIFEGVKRTECDLHVNNENSRNDLRERVPIQTLYTGMIIVLVASNSISHFNNAVMRVGVFNVVFHSTQITMYSNTKPPQSYDLLLLLPLYHVVLRSGNVTDYEKGDPLS